MQKITAVAYYGGIPPNNKNLEKPLILDNFIKGVTAAGDNGIAHRHMNTVDCDIALIQGFVHENGKNLPHLKLRKEAYDRQIREGKKALIVDSNLFLYADPSNSKRYLRYSFNGIFPTTGFYFDKDIDPQRWEKISRSLNLQLKPYRTSGDHILICLQRNGGWSMRGYSAIDWVEKTINEIRTYSKKRPIVIRIHPGDKKTQRSFRSAHKNVRISTSPTLVEDLKNAWCTVIYNSSPGIASLIEGIPLFITDTQPEYSQCNGLANLSLSDIENPQMFDRENWIQRISMCHWNFDELRSGEAWNFFKKYI